LLFRGFQFWRKIGERKRTLAFVQSDISEYSISIDGNFVGKLPNRLIGFPGAKKVNKLKDNHNFNNDQHDSKDDKK
jgi:hypothetical protein